MPAQMAQIPFAEGNKAIKDPKCQHDTASDPHVLRHLNRVAEVLSRGQVGVNSYFESSDEGQFVHAD